MNKREIHQHGDTPHQFDALYGVYTEIEQIKMTAWNSMVDYYLYSSMSAHACACICVCVFVLCYLFYRRVDSVHAQSNIRESREKTTTITMPIRFAIARVIYI